MKNITILLWVLTTEKLNNKLEVYFKIKNDIFKHKINITETEISWGIREVQ